MKKIIFSAIIITITILVHFSVESNTLNLARQQNQFNLKQVNHCVTSLLDEYSKGTSNTSDLTIAFNACAKDTRSVGVTGDIFVIRQSDRKLFWDASVDCKPDAETKLYMTENGVCSLFSDKESCLLATEHMVTVPPDGILTWTFDDAEELVDYLYLTQLVQGEQYIIGQGAQTDELSRYYNMTHLVMGISALFVIVVFSL